MKASLLISALLTLASASTFAGGSSTVGPANPAAVLCVKSGGKLAPFQTSAGTGALCQFGNHGAIEEWTFFRAKNGEKLLAVQAFLNMGRASSAGRSNVRVGMANPASVNCAKMGGQIVIGETPAGQIGICEFSDRSGIEEWTLFLGPKSSANAELVQALR